MTKCWTCGSYVKGDHYNCSSCENMPEIKKLRSVVKASLENISEEVGNAKRVLQRGFADIEQVIKNGIDEFKDAISSGFSEIASAV